MHSQQDPALEQPKLIEPVEVSPDAADVRVYIRIGEPSRYMRLSHDAWDIARRMDGSRTQAEIAREAQRPKHVVNELVQRLRDRGLLDEQTASEPAAQESGVHSAATGTRRQSLFFLKLAWHDPKFLPQLHLLLQPAVNSTTVRLASLVGVAVMAATVAASWGDVAVRIQGSLSLANAWIIWPALTLRAVLHELGHALTSLHYGRRVAGMGIGLYYFQPVAFTDVSDMWMVRERWKRLIVHVAGVAVDIFVALFAASMVLVLPEGWARTFAAFLAISAAVSAVVNLNPFLRLDGYFVLSELLHENNLRTRALRLVAGSTRWFDGTRDRRSLLLLGYGLLSFCYTSAIIGLFALALARFVVGDFFGVHIGVPNVAIWAFGAALGVGLWYLMTRRIRDGSLE